MNHPTKIKKSLRIAIFSLLGGFALAGSLSAPSFAVTATDTASVSRIHVGIEIPAGWKLGSTPYLGTVSYSVNPAADGSVSATSKRLDASINLADYVIKNGSVIATELNVNFVREGAVYGQCTFDTAAALGAPALNLADYQLRTIQRSSGEIQSQIGTCRVLGNGNDFVAGIPEVRENDQVQLVADGLSVESTLSVTAAK